MRDQPRAGHPPTHSPVMMLVATRPFTFLSSRQPLIYAIRQAGFRTHFVVGNGPGMEELSDLGPVHTIEIRRESNSFAHVAAQVLQFRRLARHCQPRLIHAFGVRPAAVTLAGARLALAGPTVVTITGLGTAAAGHGWKAKAATAGIRRMVASADTTIFQNDGDAKSICSTIRLARRASVIRGSGIDARRFSTRRPGARRTVQVLMAARLVKSKGLDTYLAAAETLRCRADVEFLLAGEADAHPDAAPLDTVIRRCSEAGVRYVGWIDEMPDFLRSVDIAVLPSRHEGLPRFLLEASAASIPCIGSRIPGITEVVDDGVTGFLVATGNADELAKAIARLCDSADLRSSMGKAGRARVAELFSVEEIVAQHLDLYERLVRGDGP